MAARRIRGVAPVEPGGDHGGAMHRGPPDVRDGASGGSSGRRYKKTTTADETADRKATYRIF